MYDIPPERQKETTASGLNPRKYASETPVMAVFRYDCPCAPAPVIKWYKRSPKAPAGTDFSPDTQEFTNAITLRMNTLPIPLGIQMGCWIAVIDTPTVFFQDKAAPKHVNIDLKIVGHVEWLSTEPKMECKEEIIVEIRDGVPTKKKA